MVNTHGPALATHSLSFKNLNDAFFLDSLLCGAVKNEVVVLDSGRPHLSGSLGDLETPDALEEFDLNVLDCSFFTQTHTYTRNPPTPPPKKMFTGT